MSSTNQCSPFGMRVAVHLFSHTIKQSYDQALLYALLDSLRLIEWVLTALPQPMWSGLGECRDVTWSIGGGPRLRFTLAKWHKFDGNLDLKEHGSSAFWRFVWSGQRMMWHDRHYGDEYRPPPLLLPLSSMTHREGKCEHLSIGWLVQVTSMGWSWRVHK